MSESGRVSGDFFGDVSGGLQEASAEQIWAWRRRLPGGPLDNYGHLIDDSLGPHLSLPAT